MDAHGKRRDADPPQGSFLLQAGQNGLVLPGFFIPARRDHSQGKKDGDGFPHRIRSEQAGSEKSRSRAGQKVDDALLPPDSAQKALAVNGLHKLPVGFQENVQGNVELVTHADQSLQVGKTLSRFT